MRRISLSTLCSSLARSLSLTLSLCCCEFGHSDVGVWVAASLFSAVQSEARVTHSSLSLFPPLVSVIQTEPHIFYEWRRLPLQLYFYWRSLILLICDWPLESHSSLRCHPSVAYEEPMKRSEAFPFSKADFESHFRKRYFVQDGVRNCFSKM